MSWRPNKVSIKVPELTCELILILKDRQDTLSNPLAAFLVA